MCIFLRWKKASRGQHSRSALLLSGPLLSFVNFQALGVATLIMKEPASLNRISEPLPTNPTPSLYFSASRNFDECDFFFSFCLIFTQYVVLLQAIVMNHWKLGKGSWISRQNFYLLKINGRILTVSHQTFTVLTKHSGRREIRLGSSYNSWI